MARAQSAAPARGLGGVSWNCTRLPPSARLAKPLPPVFDEFSSSMNLRDAVAASVESALRAFSAPAKAPRARRARSCASASRISSARRSARARASPSGMTAATRPSRDAASVGAGLGDATKHLARANHRGGERRAPGENRGERDVLGDGERHLRLREFAVGFVRAGNTCAAY